MNTKAARLLFAIGSLLAACSAPLSAQEKPLAELIAAAKSGETAARLKAIAQLGAEGSEAAVEPLAQLLKDESAEIRAHAAAALGEIGGPAKSAAPALVELLKDEDAQVRRQGVHAIMAIRPGPKVTVPLAVELLEDGDAGVRLRVLNAISEAGPAALPSLIEALSNKKAAYWACLVLRDMGPAAKDAVPALTKLLDDPRPEIRREAILALAAMEGDSEPAVPKIVALLKDPEVAVAATYALARNGFIPGNAEEIIRRNISSEDGLLSTTSLWALAKVHPDDASLRRDVTRKLIARLKDKDPFVRVQAARALAALPPAPEITEPIWEEAMKEADETTMRHALDAFAQLGASAVPRLIMALQMEKIRLEVVYILAQIGPDAAPAALPLARLLVDPNEQIAHEAALALAAIGPGAKAAVPNLLARLQRVEDANTPAIVYALGKIDPGAANAQPALANALKSEDPKVALAAAWALAQVDPPTAERAGQLIPVLSRGLKSELAVVRQGAAEALGRLGPLAKGAAPALEGVLKDEDPAVREAAEQALAAIGGKGGSK